MRWELDKKSFKSLSEYCREHTETTLDGLLDKIYGGLDAGKELREILPHNSYPAHGLVKALGCLLMLGNVRLLFRMKVFSRQLIICLGRETDEKQRF